VICFSITFFWSNILQPLQYICSWIHGLFWNHFYRNVWKLHYMLGCFEQLQPELEYEDLENNPKEWFSTVCMFYWLHLSLLCILIGFGWTIVDFVHVFIETENRPATLLLMLNVCWCLFDLSWIMPITVHPEVWDYPLF
jgi:hypothetical protein